jgi:surface protein
LGLFNLKEIKGLENLNTEKVTDMQFMFNGCSLIESLDLSGFDVSNVTNMDCMFTNCYNLHTIFVGDNWNLSDYLSSNNMFADCYSLYGEQGSMPESYKVYDASMAQIDGGDNAPGYFTKKGNSKATVTSIDFSVNPYSEHTLGEPINRQSGILNVNFNNREAQHLPYNHVNITPSGYDSTRVGKQIVTVKFLNATTTYEVNVTAKDTSYAYLDDNGVLTLYYGEYKQGAIFGSNNQFNNPGIVKKVIIDKSFANYHPTTCAEWFQFFNNMTEIKGLENLNTQYVTDMSRMFYSLQSLTTIDVSKLNTENVTSMSEMFTDCNSLTTLDVSNFNTENVTSMSSMFGDCENLKTIYVGDKWTTKNVTESENMFKYSNNLYGGKGTAYNADFTDATYAHIDGGEKNPGYFTKAPKKVINIALTAPKNLNVVEGTAIDLTGGKLTIYYNDGTSEDIPLTNENVTISEFNNSEIGEKTLTVNYNGEKVDDFTINVVAKSVASIRVTKSPEKLTYKKGEVLSVDDGEITVTYNNQTTEILAFTAEGVTISDIDNTKLGAQSITVTYSEKVATFNITVVPDKEILSITISKLPKTEYFAGEDLNISDGELTITYSDETTETAKLSIAKLSGFNSETVGKQTIKVTYLEKETTFEVNVKAVEIVSIELTTAPTKLEYIENEEFSAEGGEITVTFNNEATQKVALTDEKVSVSGFDNTKIGTQTLKVVYNEKETTFDVKVIAKSLEKIAILTQPAKVEYLEGEEFSAEGGEFVAYYNNNSSDTLELGKATISGFDNTKIGEQVLKVVYNEKTAEIKVTVNAKPEPEPEPVVENPYTKPELKDGFYQISTAEELLWFVFDVNSGDTKANAALTQDIVFNEDCLERVLKLLGISKADGDLTVWQPIGTSENAFAGIFDGQGHSISGLFINDKTQDNVGLFGATTSDAVIKNVAVVDSYISGGENVGAICGKSEGKIENCYSLSEVKGTENVNGIAGKVESTSTVENCYYLAETPKENDPCAKTAAEFKSGEVAELLAKGGEAWKDVKELPGVESVVVPDEPEQPENPENPETATFDIVVTDNVKIWSFEKTIYVENSANEIVIVDMTGKVVKRVTPISDRMEIQLNKGGIYIVKTGLSTKKIVIR